MNDYDHLVIDLDRIYRDYPLAEARRWAHPPRSRTDGLYRAALPLSWRFRLWQLLHRTNIDWGWFNRFHEYWQTVLDGRPILSPTEFAVLHTLYRRRHQGTEDLDSSDPETHLRAWQQPTALLHHFFHFVAIESVAPKIAVTRWLKKLPVRSFCEFGCAVAPVTATLRQFGGTASAVLCDLPTLNLHYAAYRFAHDPTVTVHPLVPADRFLPPAMTVDAVVAQAVFEHLLDPLLVLQALIDRLTPRGYLLFDYRATHACGLDTRQSVDQRAAFLALVKERFEILAGDPEFERGAHLVVARLR